MESGKNPPPLNSHWAASVKFRGLFEHTLDEKGRTAMPAALREVLADRSGEKSPRMILSSSLEPCLRPYLENDWEQQEDRFDLQADDDYFNLDQDVAKVRRLIIGRADNVSFDKHSRILIPPRHRKHAGLDNAVVWVGQGGYVELWSPERWEEEEAVAQADPKALLKRARQRAQRRRDS